MHAIFCPSASEHPPIAPLVGTLAADVVVLEFAFVLGTICPSETALAAFAAHDVRTLVSRTVRPNFNAMAMLLVIQPITLIPRSVGMVVDAVTVGLVAEPIALVNITIHVNKFALSLRFVQFPLAVVHGTIRPHLLTIPMPLRTQPFAGVCRAVFECVRGPRSHLADGVGLQALHFGSGSFIAIATITRSLRTHREEATRLAISEG
mmetsp:Transcript_81295/g.159597  ORF Transcript_81295/g.159597 Transcript_81295/m.159597 type:complete len:206 (-) Transcript_81295:2-619(-)